MVDVNVGATPPMFMAVMFAILAAAEMEPPLDGKPDSRTTEYDGIFVDVVARGTKGGNNAARSASDMFGPPIGIGPPI